MWGSGGKNLGQRRKRREPTATEKGGRGGAMLDPMASAFTRGDQRRRRRRPRSGADIVGVRCRRRREPAESRSTTTMTVDDDGDGGGEDRAAAAKGFVGGGECFRVCREKGQGGWVSGFTLFMLRQISGRSSLSLICSRSVTTSLQISDILVSIADLSQICHNLGGKFMAGKISDRSVTTYNLS
ncbi:hypothetical protein Scep_028291 [Stephania cephalantha]|uniref:Uncharacterized protein n=1 Tax=Stephania cephalantha TaxID=152367 RepID=A0AAP0E9P2_9MAGN